MEQKLLIMLMKLLEAYKELLMLHHYDYGELPPDNPPPAAITFGKLRPAG